MCVCGIRFHYFYFVYLMACVSCMRGWRLLLLKNGAVRGKMPMASSGRRSLVEKPCQNASGQMDLEAEGEMKMASQLKAGGYFGDEEFAYYSRALGESFRVTPSGESKLRQIIHLETTATAELQAPSCSTQAVRRPCCQTTSATTDPCIFSVKNIGERARYRDI